MQNPFIKMFTLVLFTIAAILIALIFIPVKSHAQTFSDFKSYTLGESEIQLFCNDSIVFESTTYNKTVPILAWCEDKTIDGIYFTLHHNTYMMYVPEKHTVYRAYSRMQRINVSDHFLALLSVVRDNRSYCQKSP